MPCAARANLLICWKPTLPGLGLAAEEGGSKGGPRGPYYQSERSAIYEEYYQKLVRKGLVYPCFCSRSQLHAADAPHRSDGRWYTPGPAGT